MKKPYSEVLLTQLTDQAIAQKRHLAPVLEQIFSEMETADEARARQVVKPEKSKPKNKTSAA